MFLTELNQVCECSSVKKSSQTFKVQLLHSLFGKGKSQSIKSLKVVTFPTKQKSFQAYGTILSGRVTTYLCR